MSELVKYTNWAVDASGNVAASAQVAVASALHDGTVTIYSSAAGASLANPFTAGADGYFEFWAEPGVYDVTVGTAPSAATDRWNAGAIRLTPQHFGAMGDGVTDDTDAVKEWLSAGGDLFAPAGTYLIAAAGADDGGVSATISESTSVSCADGAVFKAGTNLDNDIIRVSATPTGWTATRNLTFRWIGGKFDQRGQRNSTSIPYSDDYPPANLGESATADGLSVRGEVDSGGPKPGFFEVTIRDVEILASDDWHWETAGGDQGISVDGAKHIHVSNVTAYGSRDLAVYLSGLTSGSIDGGSAYIGGCKLHGCLFGVSTKRLLSNVQIVDNIGYNTAVVVVTTDVTTSGDNVRVSGNIGHGAWQVVRCTGGEGVKVTDNQSYAHGHLLQDGSVPTLIFTARNACVVMQGTAKSEVRGNRVVGLNAGITFDTYAVYLMDDGGTDTTATIAAGNSADGVAGVLYEEAGDANGTMSINNVGKSLSGSAVTLDGASSVDRGLPIYETFTEVAHTGTGVFADVATGTIGAGTVNSDDEIVIQAAGTITGTAGTKGFGLRLGSSVTRLLTDIPAGTEGSWWLDGRIIFNTTGSQRLVARVTVESDCGTVYAAESQDFDAGDIDVDLVFKLGATADTMTLNAFTIRYA